MLSYVDLKGLLCNCLDIVCFLMLANFYPSLERVFLCSLKFMLFLSRVFVVCVVFVTWIKLCFILKSSLYHKHNQDEKVHHMNMCSEWWLYMEFIWYQHTSYLLWRQSCFLCHFICLKALIFIFISTTQILQKSAKFYFKSVKSNKNEK